MLHANTTRRGSHKAKGRLRLKCTCSSAGVRSLLNMSSSPSRAASAWKRRAVTGAARQPPPLRHPSGGWRRDSHARASSSACIPAVTTRLYEGVYEGKGWAMLTNSQKRPYSFCNGPNRKVLQEHV